MLPGESCESCLARLLVNTKSINRRDLRGPRLDMSFGPRPQFGSAL